MMIDLAVDMVELDRLTSAVEAFCDEHDVPDKTVMQLTLVIEELFTNIVSYGYLDSPTAGTPVTLAMAALDGVIKIDLSDDGRAFNPLAAPEPDLDADLEGRQIGGLGVHFLRTMMQDLCYSRRGGRNHVGFSKGYLE
ncbi:ATP-binding protein [Pararhizobium sp.]|uniref:ATP-binding protein n=1 Tax=Pararhizobium sp. TaxID=1977563 RepID=UPI003D138F45